MHMARTGRTAGVNLGNLGWFPGQGDGMPDRKAARFGLELAQLAYDLKAGPWLAAGWRDMSIQMERRIVPGPRADEEAGNLLDQARSAVMPRIARGMNAVMTPIAQVREFFGDRGASITGQAVTLLLPHADGTYTVAAGFMGTGRRPRDWLVNLRMAHPEGFHEGFAAIAGRFLDNAAHIRFPAAAGALGEGEPTLADVIGSLKSPASPFRLVLAGHSQGAAVLQVVAHRLLKGGVRPEYLSGFGFASPFPALGLVPRECEAPLSLFLFSDDVFTRVGLRERVGACYMLEATEEIRLACYGRAYAEGPVRETMRMLDGVRDAEDAFTMCLGYLEALSHRPWKVISSSLAEFFEGSLLNFPAMAERWIQRVLRWAILGFEQSFADVAGNTPDPEKVALMRDQADALMASHGAVRFTRTLVRALYLTHALKYREHGRDGMAPYLYLVTKGYGQIRRCPQPLPDETPAPGIQEEKPSPAIAPAEGDVRI
ncbi:MAG TPA: hypothetical protein VLA21_10185 [Candidatus Limnocylindria bacterium]|nr:hypothetical protein [Candidatus Limnocylindria bacterium]